MKETEVLVLDSERRFLDYTHPATARKLLKEGKAVVYSRNPFAIQLNKAVEAPGRFKRKEIDMGVVNFTKFFEKEQDVYVQNVSNCQVSVQFNLGPGQSESFLFHASKDPVNLTQRIPFHAIKQSMDFRKMLNRVPPALQVLNEDEYQAFYARQAKSQNLKSIDEAIQKADERAAAARGHIPMADAPKPMKTTDVHPEDAGKAAHVQEQDEVKPQILNLCLQVHAQLDEQSRMPAQQFISELDQIPDLNMMDWEYVQGHGYYKSVKNLARKKIADLAAAEGEIGGAEDTAEAQ